MKNRITDLDWYDGKNYSIQDSPGITHSLISSLATTLHHTHGIDNPAWIMGITGFAFRNFISETFCPSAYSMFSWKEIIPQAAHQCGFDCDYYSRMWDQQDVDEEQTLLTRNAIISAIDQNIPAIVWDIYDTEWGLITGYKSKSKKFITMGNDGKEYSLPFERLGKNGVNVLSVLIIKDPNGIEESELIKNSLQIAVDHAEGNEEIDRPEYENGLKVYDYWISGFDKWKMLLEAKSEKNIGVDMFVYMRYNLHHLYSARFYACEYLKILAKDYPLLSQSQLYYEQISEKVKDMHDYFLKNNTINPETLDLFKEKITEIKSIEESAISSIKESGLL